MCAVRPLAAMKGAGGGGAGAASTTTGGESTGSAFAESSNVGEMGPYEECLCRIVSISAVVELSSVVIGNGCTDLRREPVSLLGFECRDLKGLWASVSPTGIQVSLRGDCGVGEESLEVFLVPVPDADVAVDMYEKRERPRSWSSCI